MINAKTKTVSVASTIKSDWFKLGRADMKAGRGFCLEYEVASGSNQHRYEKGRMTQLLMQRYGMKNLTLKGYSSLRRLEVIL